MGIVVFTAAVFTVDVFTAGVVATFITVLVGVFTAEVFTADVTGPFRGGIITGLKETGYCIKLDVRFDY